MRLSAHRQPLLVLGGGYREVRARVAEPVDAGGLNPPGGNTLWVRIPPRAPKRMASRHPQVPCSSSQARRPCRNSGSDCRPVADEAR